MYGVQKRVFGTVLASRIGRMKDVLIQFDKQPNSGGEVPWYSEAKELIPFGLSEQKFQVNQGDRVVLEYITSPGGGLWYARIPQPGEIQ